LTGQGQAKFNESLADRVETRSPPALAISIGQQNELVSEVSETATRSVKTCSMR
jgi:hypothetical protein